MSIALYTVEVPVSHIKMMVNEITIKLGNGIGRKCIVAVDMHYIFTTRGTKARATSLSQACISLVHDIDALTPSSIFIADGTSTVGRTIIHKYHLKVAK